MKLADEMSALGADDNLIRFCDEHPDMGLQEFWDSYDHPGHLLWLCARNIRNMRWQGRQHVVAVALMCAELVRKNLAGKKFRDVKDALDIIFKWTKCEASFEQLGLAYALSDITARGLLLNLKQLAAGEASVAVRLCAEIAMKANPIEAAYSAFHVPEAVKRSVSRAVDAETEDEIKMAEAVEEVTKKMLALIREYLRPGDES